ncbi:MAG: hypothetical protein DSZ05_06235 [Sulfurospirillum sp.]|nr:MAG: hypothetical protein DSZ05_06235 [Sulfurospirillum sp.]
MTHMTDQELAHMLGKRTEEISALKKEDPQKYKLLLCGAVCYNLDLTEEDLELYAKQKQHATEHIR